jgi:hypothetical protein
LQKYFASHLTQITSTFIAVSSYRGALAIVTDAGRDAVDAAAFKRAMESQGGFSVSDHSTHRREMLAADGEVVWS